MPSSKWEVHKALLTWIPMISTLRAFTPLHKAHGVCAGSSDLFLLNRICLKRWNVTSEIRLQNDCDSHHVIPSCPCSHEASCHKSQSIERPICQGIDRVLQPTTREELRLSVQCHGGTKSYPQLHCHLKIRFPPEEPSDKTIALNTICEW